MRLIAPTSTLGFAVTVAGAVVALVPHMSAAQSSHSHSDHRNHATHHTVAANNASTGGPIESGEAAFASIAEIVALLRGDPQTDWSKVDITALREHLLDMHYLMLETEVETELIAGGLRMRIGGSAKAKSAASRMVSEHSRVLARTEGWSTSVNHEDGLTIWNVTAEDPATIQQIRGLGFYGLMATGTHHQPHHLAVARGQPMH